MKKTILVLSALILLLSCNSSKEKDSTSTSENKEGKTGSAESMEERNKKAVMTSLEAFNQGDFEKAFQGIVTDEFTDYGDGSTPPVKSLDSVKAFFKMFKEAVPDYKGSNFEFIAEGNKVVVVGEWSGTFKNDMMGMKATGKTFKFKDADIFTFNEEGKVTSHSNIANLGMVLMK